MRQRSGQHDKHKTHRSRKGLNDEDFPTGTDGTKEPCDKYATQEEHLHACARITEAKPPEKTRSEKTVV